MSFSQIETSTPGPPLQSTKALGHTFRAFDNLPRPRASPNRQMNRWILSAQKLPVDPPGYFVLAILPGECYIQAGPADIQSTSTEAEKFETFASLILYAFASSERISITNIAKTIVPFKPWSWATEDIELARAIRAILRRHGVRRSLLYSPILCSQDEKRILQDVWAILGHIMTDMMGPKDIPGDVSRCYGCGMNADSVPEPLLACEDCNKAFYHSPDCRIQHRNQHEPLCCAYRVINNTDMDPHALIRNVSSMSPQAQFLLRSLHLEFALCPEPFVTV